MAESRERIAIIVANHRYLEDRVWSEAGQEFRVCRPDIPGIYSDQATWNRTFVVGELIILERRSGWDSYWHVANKEAKS
jgi:hypothetical protein